MGYEDMIKQFDNSDFLNKLYGFAYKRCNDSHSAEDLCSEIIVKVLSSARNNSQIEHIPAYIWGVAYKVYADFCEKRRLEGQRLIRGEFFENIVDEHVNPIEEFLENEQDGDQLRNILRNIAFLSKIYRDVMVMYYIDGMKTADIAKELNISETAVKQRLFSARNQIKEEAETMQLSISMQSDITLKPMNIHFIGKGNPTGNDPRHRAERILSKNMIYLCRNQALSAKEMSEKLNVPLLYIEDEIDILLKGENGSYGLLREMGKDKYVSNIIILDIAEIQTGIGAYTKHLKELCTGLKDTMAKDSEKIRTFPFLSKQNDPRFVLWSLISNVVWKLGGSVCNTLEQDYFKEVDVIDREFSLSGISIKNGEQLKLGFYGIDGFRDTVADYSVYGYSSIFVSNIYGARMDKHFACDHHVLTDPLLLITLHSIGGLAVDSLSDCEKETAAKAIECGYLRREGNLLFPRIIIFSEEKTDEFRGLLSGLNPTIDSIADKIAAELSGLIKRYVPFHLMNEYPMFEMLVSTKILNDLIEACIDEDLLTIPESRLCAEGVVMIVK